MTPLHPEATEDPATLRWVTSGAPSGVLAALIDDGTLADVEVLPDEVRTSLAPGRSWARDGARVRTALFQALSSASPDLQFQIATLLAREVGPFVESHGGRLEVVSVHEDTLDVAMNGTCGSCTLRGRTLTDLVLTTVRAQFPQIRSVNEVRV